MSWLIFLALLLPAPQDSQFPPIGIIDFYGLRNISERQVRESLQIKEGDSLSEEPIEAKRRLESLQGVAEAPFELVCCDAGKAILFVGIRENGTPSLQFRPAPHSWALLRLTDKRAPAVLSEIHQKALPSLIEMARWKSSGHAQASFVLLGRVAGLPEDEIAAAWERGDPASFMETAIKRAKAK